MAMNGRKAQAITEFVIILPVMLLLFAMVAQLAMLSVSRIKLEMLEREIMRYLTTVDEDKKKGEVEAFAKEMGQKMGLEQDRLGIEQGKWGKEKGESPFTNLKFVNDILKTSWTDIVVTYEQPLFKPLASLTGKQSITLKAHLFTAKADSFTLSFEQLKKWFESFIGSKHK
jgi:hypothetical protein